MQIVRRPQYLVAKVAGPPGADKDQGNLYLRDSEVFESCTCLIGRLFTHNFVMPPVAILQLVLDYGQVVSIAIYGKEDGAGHGARPAPSIRVHSHVLIKLRSLYDATGVWHKGSHSGARYLRSL
jgi:hypothetical protein